MRTVALVALAVFVSVPALLAQETQFRSLPPGLRSFQIRSDQQRSGEQPPQYQGTASISPEHAQPYMDSIGIAGLSQERGHFCGAITVAPRWVLTAAHCVAEAVGGQLVAIDPNKLQILSGTKVLYRGGKSSTPIRVVLHPQFRVTEHGVPENDLALLEFKDSFAEAPVTIATDAEFDLSFRPGEKLIILGWGTASFNASSPISTNLLQAFVDGVERTKCNQIYGGAVTEQMFCAGLGTADSCQGDSGGPALGFDANGLPVLIGIVSWGVGCAQKSYPGVYVNVIKYRGWIDATVGKQ